MCGPACVSAKDLGVWEDFFYKLDSGFAKPSFIEDSMWAIMAKKMWCLPEFTQVPRYRRDFELNPGSVSHLHMVLITDDLQASNPRDKLYSILGLCTNRIVVDYEASVRTVYSKFAKMCIEEGGDLSILEWAGINNPASVEITEDNIPSWAPDWHSVSKSNILPFNTLQCKSSIRCHLKAKASVESGILTWLGTDLKIGRIQSCVSFVDPGDRYEFCCKYAHRSNPLHPTGNSPITGTIQNLFSTSLIHTILLRDWTKIWTVLSNSD
jgi:hypothetical protein